MHKESIIIINLTAHIVMEFDLSNNFTNFSEDFDLTSLPKGIYFFKGLSLKGDFTRKLFKTIENEKNNRINFFDDCMHFSICATI